MNWVPQRGVRGFGKETIRLSWLTWFGLAVLLCVFVYCFYYALQSGGLARHGRDYQVLRIAHWQLESGFREALQEVIDAYNQEPHVQAARVRVEQLAIPQNYYGQFVNVHLIGGTAPDLLQLGRSTLVARHGPTFFMPLDAALAEPNPHNRAEELEPLLTAAQVERLVEGSWQDNFTNQLNRTLFSYTGHHFAVPLAAGGTVRFFYNRTLLREAKEVLAQALQPPVTAPWLRSLLADNPDLATLAITRNTEELREWLLTDAAPRSFGEFILLCEAVQQMALAEPRSGLMPITAHRDIDAVLAGAYRSLFLYPFARSLDFNSDGMMTGTELFAALQQDTITFRNERVQTTFEFWRRLAQYFPQGFIGMDREQATRRFLSGKALFHPAGSWDAVGIFRHAEGMAPASRFEVGVFDPVIPKPGDRWGAMRPRLSSEANIHGGLYFALTRGSANGPLAKDFLRYLTSFRQNSQFIQSIGWIPLIEGVVPNERAQPFTPRFAGANPFIATGFIEDVGNPALRSLFMTFLSGNMAYPAFSREFLAILQNPRLGVAREWSRKRQNEIQMLGQVDRSLEIARFRQLVESHQEGLAEAVFTPTPQQMRLMRHSSRQMGGRRTMLEWRLAGYETPFPEFQ